MAVVQISRIQIRRGQKNQGLGIPQLASGELGWAIDSQELFIGNGAVAEGAPTVGNTKILTQFDDILALARTYSYKANEAYIVTGASSVGKHLRTLQERLDDRVSVKAFGITGEETQNATGLLQQAINQLYINNTTKYSERSRVILYFEPGVYSIDNPIFIPPFATLVGAGPEKTIIRQTANTPIFQTMNDSSTLENWPAESSTNQITNQARQILVHGMTLQNETSYKGIVLIDCTDGIFSNLDIIGSWSMGDEIPATFNSSIGVEFVSSSTNGVKTKNIYFEHCRVKNWGYGMLSSYDIENISVDKSYFEECGNAISYGVNMNLGAEGQSQGTMQSSVSNTVFRDINSYGIWIENGENNKSQNNQFYKVGTNGSTEGNPVTSIIRYRESGNSSTNDYFQRTEILSYDDSYINSPVPYTPEIEGMIFADFEKIHSRTFGVSSTGVPTRLFRLAGYANQTYFINYHIVGNSSFTIKTGCLTITSGLAQTSQIGLSDEYDYIGDLDNEDILTFSTEFVDADSLGGYDSIAVNITNPIADVFTIKYKISLRKLEL